MTKEKVLDIIRAMAIRFDDQVLLPADFDELANRIVSALQITEGGSPATVVPVSESDGIPPPRRGCMVCGSAMVWIRGQYPHTDRREICPTCTYERLEQIVDIASPHHGLGYIDPLVDTSGKDKILKEDEP